MRLGDCLAVADPSITSNVSWKITPQKSQITAGADWERSERLQLARKKAGRKNLFFVFFFLLYKVSKHLKYSGNLVYAGQCVSCSCISFSGCCCRSDKAAYRKIREKKRRVMQLAAFATRLLILAMRKERQRRADCGGRLHGA